MCGGDYVYPVIFDDKISVYYIAVEFGSYYV